MSQASSARPASWLAEAGWRLWRWASGGAVAAALVPFGLAVAAGAGPARAAGLGAAASYLFFSLGHGAQIACARFDARFLLAASLAAYGLQAGLATCLMALAADAGWPVRWVFGGVAAGTFGWLGGLLLCYSRLRVPVFDPSPAAPLPRGMTSPASPDRLHRDERSAGQ
ncbi:MAG: hypothetical protein LBI84_02220 [Propionibacteriaceae bacterium]|nr:hypothetical protein [Propionibacteriaceae bacterium]